MSDIEMNENSEGQGTDSSAAELPEKTWHVVLAYNGTAYSGWQVQSDHKTIQGELRMRLRLMLQEPELRVMGCSRTDAGVHALDQHASFTLRGHEELTPEWLCAKLNRWLPEDILVKSVCIEPNGFNPRYDNFGKAYTYCISPGVKTSPMAAPFVWKTPKVLDVDAMRKAAAYLVGEHDFASFAANPGIDIGSTVRKLWRLDVLEHGGLVYVSAVGESFLYKMVRGLTGYLVHVGSGYAAPEDAKRVLEAKKRSEAADSAPGKGLFLAKVFWNQDEWREYVPVLPPFSIQ